MTPEQRASEAAEKIHYIGPKLLFTEKVEIILSALNAQREEDRATIAELTTDGNAVTLAANLAQASIERDRLQATVDALYAWYDDEMGNKRDEFDVPSMKKVFESNRPK